MRLSASVPPAVVAALLGSASWRPCEVRTHTLHMCAPPPAAFDEQPLEQLNSLLHTSVEAAAAQQQRLRKVDAIDGSVDGCTDTAPTTAPLASPRAPSAVHLVGVGPGDVELLTVKALRLMSSADLVLYDRLISPEVLGLVNPSAAMLYVGKEKGLHTRKQDEIHALLLHFATAGRTVVRLKGGDPTVVGRGGEELDFLERQGVKVHVVPGITAASGIAARLGVPLTHRDHADSVRFITGHARSESTASLDERYPWAQLADARTTLVIYMGLSTLPDLAEGLVHAGLDAATPAVAVQDGTTPTQRVVSAPLGEIAERVLEAELRSPTLVVIGSVVSLLAADAEHEHALAEALLEHVGTPTAAQNDMPEWAELERLLGGEGTQVGAAQTARLQIPPERWEQLKDELSAFEERQIASS